MNPLRGKLIVQLNSALLIGGYGSSGSHVDAQTAKDQNGQPFIPASTLKGALREACTRLQRARKLRACTPIDPCPAGKPCLICEIFGTSGPIRAGFTIPEEERDEREAGEEAQLRIGNATGLSNAEYALRPGVAIDRKLGAAVPGVYFEREVLDEPGAELMAPIWGHLSPQALQLFEDALPLVTGIGNSRSRGLGQISLRFEPDSAPHPGIRIDVPEDKPCEQALVIVDAREPLVLSPRPSANSIYRTLSYLPGSTLRGAIAHAILRGGIQAEDPRFQRAFVDPRQCLRFSDAWPAQKNNNSTLPYPLPPSTLQCKHANHETHQNHRWIDTLLQQALARAVLKTGGVWIPPKCPAQGCGEPLRSAEGVYPYISLQRRIVTRLGRDIKTGSALQGMLYSVEQLAPGTRFIGTLRGLDSESRQLLEQAREVLVGQGRSRGQGLLDIQICSPLADVQAQITARRKAFQERASKLWTYALQLGAKLPADPKGLVALVTRTDLSLPPGESAESLLEQCLFEGKGAMRLLALQNTNRRSGWDEGYDEKGRRNAPFARPIKTVVKAGSVFLMHGDIDDRRLAQLETQGIGEDRHLGLGHLVFYPEILTKGWSA